MDAAQLLEEFGTVAEAPGGVDELRGLVLDLAIRGRLVEGHSGWGTAASTLEQSKPRKKADLNPVDDEPFTIPDHWRWVRFSRVAEHRLGKMLDKAKNQGELRPYLRNANVRWFDFELSDLLEMRVREDELDEVTLRPGDLVICEGGEPGRCAIWSGDPGVMVIQKALHRARPIKGVRSRYLALCLWAATMTGRITEFFTGATIKHFTGRSLARFPVPLPPTGEQDQILTRVDELLALIDELETQQSRRSQLSSLLPPSLYQPLTTAATPTGRTTAWRRVVTHFDDLTTHPDQVPALRQAILELAVRGRLVEAGAESRDSRLPCRLEGPDGELLPEGWTWATPEELRSDAKYSLAIGPFGSNLLKSDYRSEGVPLVFVREITRKAFGDEKTKFVTPEKAVDLRAHQILPGDLLITKMGAPPGDTAIYPLSRPPAIITADCIRFVPTSDLVDTSYLRAAIESPVARRQILDITKGVAHQKISLKRFRSILLPVPPLAEQDRIVARVDELMSLCDDLEDRLTCRQSIQERLAEALTAVA